MSRWPAPPGSPSGSRGGASGSTSPYKTAARSLIASSSAAMPSGTTSPGSSSDADRVPPRVGGRDSPKKAAARSLIAARSLPKLSGFKGRVPSGKTP